MILAAHDVTVALGRRTVLEALTLAVGQGELTALIGPNGAGKSTCLRALAGLIAPSHGSITIDDRPLASLGLSDRARTIGYLPQQRIVHWPLTVARTVALGRVPHRRSEAEDDIAVTAAMVAMDVDRFRDRPATELSGGELARVLMARVLAQDTPVLLADEPTAGLDPAHQIILMERLAGIASEGRTVVVAVHDLWLAARYCHRILLLKDGRLLADGIPASVLTASMLRAAFGVNVRIETYGNVPIVLPVGLC